MSAAVERVLRALEAADAGLKQSGSGWIARCPAHEDRSPSLSVGVGGGGRALVRCFAGCATSDVLAAPWTQCARPVRRPPLKSERETVHEVRAPGAGTCAKSPASQRATRTLWKGRVANPGHGGVPRPGRNHRLPKQESSAARAMTAAIAL